MDSGAQQCRSSIGAWTVDAANPGCVWTVPGAWRTRDVLRVLHPPCGSDRLREHLLQQGDDLGGGGAVRQQEHPVLPQPREGSRLPRAPCRRAEPRCTASASREGVPGRVGLGRRLGVRC